jgi:hypothetical protein
MFPDGKAENNVLYRLKMSTDPDTMYLDNAMKEPDREQFRDAMLKEVKYQMEIQNFTIVSRESVPANDPVMLTVWKMKQKQDIIT